MLCEVEIKPAENQVDREGARILKECQVLGAHSIRSVLTAHSYLLEGDLDQSDLENIAQSLLSDPIVETFEIRILSGNASASESAEQLLNVLFKPGVTDNVANSAREAIRDLGLSVENVATCRKYWINSDAKSEEADRMASKVLSNDAIEQVVRGPLRMDSIKLGSEYTFELVTIPIRAMNDQQLETLSREGQLYLNLTEMQTIKKYYVDQAKDPTDIELESVAQTWSEHCSHKTLAGRIHYQDGERDLHFENMLKETIFSATTEIRKSLGDKDWCVSVFVDNAGVITFDEKQDVCFKVETHNHPSALEPYGGANTGLGGVIRDPLGTGLGGRPVCNTDVFCFAPPEISYDDLPTGVLHPKAVATGVVSGVRDYGNRMGIPTVNGAVYFDERYLGNPLVYCGNVAMLPVGKSVKQKTQPGHYIVAVGGRTGRDGIHGATFSSAELTSESESLSGGAVQIGNAITEKMTLDVILEARDKELFSAITDCGAGGFSSAVGEMGEDTGAEVWLDQCPLKYAGLSYTEIWISEAQERMVLAVPPENWDAFEKICAGEGVEASIIGKFTDTSRLVLKYQDQIVGDLEMSFLHDGRPPVIREAIYHTPPFVPLTPRKADNYNKDLKSILGSLNVCSKEWIIRQYDQEVQAGSVIKPLVGVQNDGPSDAAVVRPDLTSARGLVISCGMNPRYGDLNTHWMAASAIDEAIRNCVAVGADPEKIAILDNFCWGNTDRPETLGSLVAAALACQEFSIAFGAPFISGKDSLYNEFSYENDLGEKETVSIPASLLISAIGQIANVNHAITMDLKTPGNLICLIGSTQDELGGSHFALVNDLAGGQVPQVDKEQAPKIFKSLHTAIQKQLIRSCHDLSEGGLAVAAAEMAFAGGFGMKLDLNRLPEALELSTPSLLFSESNSRFLIEVSSDKIGELQSCFPDLPLVEIGEVVSNSQFTVKGKSGRTVIDASLDELKSAWKTPLAWD
ncbi:MAG: phosphoribosylformylglycinamidine synthase subunit PurL [Planctomycetes bacterium]|nr:phosphoribosylformylglycinamidine synthase subunit PurL [Planctomycetota bacterium]MCH9724336.1 phosphoribosylformylglycinamidine synthase subunit PurL [Planctomycetota bacterium]MCH9777355.1 phosphoribosylformylglycinamidine synthase subunit PurL [Planctomycetota bacterium]MCH9792322.1 phosphoribosylformylglycinamidine synthase subunit PurL [Planctomycetota bacterium]MDF1742165.1 phosphoribosylformylglycinamidine synthase subunit PurL [Gimesia sp.]